MRKDSWFRGPFLSVLFFALLIGPMPALGDFVPPNLGEMERIIQDAIKAALRNAARDVGDTAESVCASLRRENRVVSGVRAAVFFMAIAYIVLEELEEDPDRKAQMRAFLAVVAASDLTYDALDDLCIAMGF